MNPIYLSKVEISNFRTYGEDFSIDLPDEPGLTVLCGMNGLGKTAFFDAIEWALLGDIQRLARLGSAQGGHLTREGATAGSHKVKLSWGTGDNFTRTQQDGPALDDLISLLKSPSWTPQIRDLDVYLRLTHFLPQTSRERFLEKDPNAKWSFLQGPAGVERLDRLRKLLDDTKARNAFVRHISELERKHEDAAERLTGWNSLLAEQKKSNSLASAAASISPDELNQILEGLEASVPIRVVDQLSSEPIQRLVEIRKTIELLSASLDKRLIDLKQFKTSRSRYAELVDRMQVIQDSQVNTEKDLEEVRRSQEKNKETVTKSRATDAELQTKKSVAANLATSAERVLESEIRRITASKLKTSLNEKIAEWNKRLVELEQHQNAHRKQVDDYNGVVKGLEVIRQKLEALIKTEDAFSATMQSVNELTDLRGNVMALTARKKTVSERKIALEQAIEGLNTKLKDLRVRLSAEQHSMDEATQALGIVVKHLSVEDDTCPVCAQVYPTGELLRKAQGSIERFSYRSGTLINELRKVQKDVEDATKSLSDVHSELREVDGALLSRTTRVAEIEKQKQELLQRPEIAGTSLETLPAVLKERQSVLQQQEQEFRASATKLRISDEQAIKARLCWSEVSNIRTELQAANEQLRHTNGVLEQCQTKLAAADEIIKTGGGLERLSIFRSERLSDVAKLELEIQNSQEQLKEHEEKLLEASAKVSAKLAKIESEKKNLTQFKEETAQIVSNWHILKLDGEPNESTLKEACLSAMKAVGENEAVLKRISKTAEGVEAWKDRSKLDEMERAVADSIESVGVKSMEECSDILQQRVKIQEDRIAVAESARDRAREVAEKLTELAGTFCASALEPLNDRVSGFNRLISPFPYQFKLNPHITATRTSARARVTLPSVTSNQVLERDPAWWLSEGQMSAMGLSVLLGASTVYSWSRWRALLMDDPLQNTDLIHAAAFGDVIRNLVVDQRYQIILSSHNLDEADYLIRKCRRAKLPVRKVELLSLGPAGVKYTYREC